MIPDSITRIKGGHVIDASTGESAVRDVWIVNGSIAAPNCAAMPEREDGHASPATYQEIDASGCYVVPGFVDFHLHMFRGGTEIGLDPDCVLPAQGVTLAADQGSSGVANCDAFYASILARSAIRTYAFLHLCPAGLATTRYLENIDPATFDPVAVKEVFARYPHTFLGLKIRQSREIAGNYGLAPLERTLCIAEDIGVPVVVHTTDPAGDIEAMASMLRPKDVFSHVYHGRGQTILDTCGKVRPAVQKARERGVFFDTADGRVHYGLRQIRQAFAQGFFPDSISTDLTRLNMFFPPVFGLPFIMAKYLAFGMELEEVVRAVTVSPIRMLGLDSAKLGTLRPGARADLTVFALRPSDTMITDKAGETLTLSRMVVPQMTYRDGKVLYRNIEF